MTGAFKGQQKQVKGTLTNKDSHTNSWNMEASVSLSAYNVHTNRYIHTCN